MNLNERIRYLRTKNNMSSKELSKILNISESSVSLYESGKRTPSLSLIIRIADHFNVSTDYLLGKTNMTKQYCAPDSEFDFASQLQSIINTFDESGNILLFNGYLMNEQFKKVLKKTLIHVTDTMNILSGDFKSM